MTRPVYVLALTLYASAAMAQWSPPAGVPVPPFGITEVAPAPNLFVNEAIGNDSNPGTAAKPKRTIPRILAAGTVVQITGTQSMAYTSPNTLVANGTAAQPVYLEGGTFQDGLELTGRYVIVEHFVSRGGWSVNADHWAFRDFEATGGGIAIVQWLGTSPLNDWTILRGKFHDIGTPPSAWATGGDADSHGVGVGHHASYGWILDSDFRRISGDGLQVNGEGFGPQTHHIYFARNTCDQNRQSCGWAKQSADVVMSENVCTRMRDVDGLNPGNCFGAQYQATRVVFLKNTASDADYGIRIGGDSTGPFDVLVAGNTLHNIHSNLNSGSNPQSPGGAIVFTNNGNRLVAANTITDVDTGVGIANSGGTVAIVNNTITQTTHPGVYESPQPVFSVDLSKVSAAYQANHGVPLGVDLGTGPVIGPAPPPPPPVVTPPPTKPPLPACPHTLAGALGYIFGRCNW